MKVSLVKLAYNFFNALDIEFKHVNITTPTGDLLVNDLSFLVRAGMSCLISGPNGSGKSSLFRLLGGLWPLFGGGVITRPAVESGDLFYVPQKPYLPLGSLRDQLIYPFDEASFRRAGHTDEELLELLKIVHLEYLVEREEHRLGSSSNENLLTEALDVVRDWQDVLSGGEKQRIAMARLFLHRPRFAILDECTSAVSIDVEGQLYRYAQETLKMTLFTISHRPSLNVFHSYRLQFDGQGGYSFGPLNPEENGEKAPESTPAKPVQARRRMSTTAMEVADRDFVVGSVDANVGNDSTPQFIYSYPRAQGKS